MTTLIFSCSKYDTLIIKRKEVIFMKNFITIKVPLIFLFSLLSGITLPMTVKSAGYNAKGL